MEATLNKSQEELLNKLYPDAKAIKLKVDLNFPNCSLHLFRIPKSIDPQLLLNKKIKLKKSESKVKIDGEKYVVEKTSKNPDPVLVLGKRAKVLTLSSNFIMKKFIKPNPEPEIEVPEKTCVAVHDKLKTRHPLFGSAFTDKVVLEEQTQMKLDDAISKVMKAKEKSPKKKQPKQKKEPKEQQEVIFSLLADKSKTKSKPDVSDDSAFSSSSSLSKVDKPQKKNTNDFLQNMIKHMKQEVLTTYETEEEAEGRATEKKKKKRKSDEHRKTADINQKNKRRHSEPSKQVMTAHETESEEETIGREFLNTKREILTTYETDGDVDSSPQKKKKKKKKRASDTGDDWQETSIATHENILSGTTTNLKQELFSTYETEGETETNTKQKKKKRTSGAMKQEVLTSYETEGETESSPKKKQKRDSYVKKEVLTSYETDADEGALKKKKKKQRDSGLDLSVVKREVNPDEALENSSTQMFEVEPFSTLSGEFKSAKKKRKSKNE